MAATVEESTPPDGYGVLIFDRVSGDVIDTWQAGRGANGISNNNVYSLHRDSGGSMWVGTANGADRYQVLSNGSMAMRK